MKRSAARGVCILHLVSLILGVVTARSAAQVVTRGPYLGTGTPSSVVVRWRTDTVTDTRVWYGTDVGGLTSFVDGPGDTTEHEVTVSGLQADTQYIYGVGTPGGILEGGGEDYYFRTSPLHGTRVPTRVWLIGDCGTGDSNADAVYDSYRRYNNYGHTDVWIMLGDNAYHTGTDSEYQSAVFDTYPEMLQKTVLWPTRGNHDVLHGGANNDYYDIFTMPTGGEAGGLASGTEAYYSYNFANIHFVCLDSEGSDRSLGGPMLTWLANDLANNTQDWTIAYWHHPPYTKGSHDSDDPSDSGGRMWAMRMNANRVLEDGGVDLVFSGHSHSYERSFLVDEHYGWSWELVDSMKINVGDGRIAGDGAYTKSTQGPGTHEGTVYTVAGSSGWTGGGSLDHPVMVTSLNLLGSVVLDISGNILNAVFIDNESTALDEFTVIKGVTPSGVNDPVAVPRLVTGAPNPFSIETTIRYSLPSSGPVSVAIYDVKGRQVRQLVRADQAQGDHVTVWDGKNTNARRVAPGVYFGVLEFSGERRTRKVVFVR
jgi:hypothetical protein